MLITTWQLYKSYIVGYKKKLILYPGVTIMVSLVTSNQILIKSVSLHLDFLWRIKLVLWLLKNQILIKSVSLHLDFLWRIQHVHVCSYHKNIKHFLDSMKNIKRKFNSLPTTLLNWYNCKVICVKESCGPMNKVIFWPCGAAASSDIFSRKISFTLRLN